MIHELAARQILALADQGSSVEEISLGLEIPVELVKLVLSRNATNADRDITDEQLVALRQRAYALAMQDECLPVSARMVEFLVERDKPREKVQVSPIVAINNALVVANEQFKGLLDGFKNEKVVS